MLICFSILSLYHIGQYCVCFSVRYCLSVKLNTFVGVKSDKTINERLCFADGLRLEKRNAFGFENGKEIFCHSIVVWVRPSLHRRSNAVLRS